MQEVEFDIKELTKSQLMIWLGQKLLPHSPMYNMAISFRWENLSVDRFRAAFQQLVEQSDAMRTVFVEDGGIPKQKLLAQFPYQVEIIDISSSSDIENELEIIEKERSELVFDMGACLFDAVLIKVSAVDYVWYFNQHHLIIDAWGVTVQFKYLAQFYISNSEQIGTKVPTYAQYIDAIPASKETKPYKNALCYWEERLSTLPQPPTFYGKRNIEQKSQSERILVKLDPSQTLALNKFIEEKEIKGWTPHLTLFNVYATVLFSLIYRITDQENVSIGTPAHNRTTTDLKNTPGLFIELFPILARIHADHSFLDLYKNVQIGTNEFLLYGVPHSSTPETSRSFNVVLNYINASFENFNDITVQTKWIHSGHADPSHHLRLQVYDFDGQGQTLLGFDMNTSIFSESQRKEIPEIFNTLLDNFIADRYQAIRRPSIIAKGIQTKKASLTSEFTNTISSLQNNLSSSDALIMDEVVMSYKTLNEHVNQLANYLNNNGVVKGDRIAILLERSPEFIICVLAILRLGATFIPIPVNQPQGRIMGILDNANPRLCLTKSGYKAGSAKVIHLDKESAFISNMSKEIQAVEIHANDLAYIMYTSGSTGLPKGVKISHRALNHYLNSASTLYKADANTIMPLFTSVGFDLTITSVFLPLINGGAINIYQEPEEGPDLAILDVIKDNKVNCIKLTPSHIKMIDETHLKNSILRTVIVGGENFEVTVAKFLHNAIGNGVKIYNEYGPTEFTVGCMVHQYVKEDEEKVSVPIGKAFPETTLHILDEYLNRVQSGSAGELYLEGKGMASGYLNDEELTASVFIQHPTNTSISLYKTGDIVSRGDDGVISYHGRKDQQVKIRGRRIELSEIESALNGLPAIQQVCVDLKSRVIHYRKEVQNCIKCGLPSNYPDATFDQKGTCNYCLEFENYQQKVEQYFRSPEDLKNLLFSVDSAEKGKYDCLTLLSGGKDSTYVLAKLKEMGLNILAFTLDNGYISKGAMDNVDRIVKSLGVDHVYGTTEAMDAIFVDSLETHCNVCDGCFKTIYTLSAQIAIEKKIPFIITGLSRGQFFETRLTEELFRTEDLDGAKIDQAILDARKAYHQVDDAVKQLMDTSIFDDPETFEKVRFVDFYRYTDVPLSEMLSFLDEQLSWVRPADTGRSTNCLINQAGIYVHKKERGYSNYAFPYSWDVRVGHKTRDASLEEINEVINEEEVHRILNEIGYTGQRKKNQKEEQLIAYYSGSKELSTQEIKRQLSNKLPDYMIPVQYVHVDAFRLTINGKIDKSALPLAPPIRPDLEEEYIAPDSEFEIIVHDIWSDVLGIENIGVHDQLLDIGGDSLSAIRIIARINDELDLELSIRSIFDHTTIHGFAIFLESKIKTLLEEMG